MDKMQLMSFYDRLCNALTEYENRPDDENDYDDYHDGIALYHKIVDIVNDLAIAIN